MVQNINDPKLKEFNNALHSVLLNLAKRIIADGEGASKFITIVVNNSKTQEEWKKIAFSIANSSLVKTAMSGEDPNWGRIIMGIGKSGEMIDSKKLKIKLGDFIVAENGKISDSYNEEKLKEYMKWDSITIEVNLRLGSDSFECYTCDFSESSTSRSESRSKIC